MDRPKINAADSFCLWLTITIGCALCLTGCIDLGCIGGSGGYDEPTYNRFIYELTVGQDSSDTEGEEVFFEEHWDRYGGMSYREIFNQQRFAVSRKAQQILLNRNLYNRSGNNEDVTISDSISWAGYYHNTHRVLVTTFVNDTLDHPEDTLAVPLRPYYSSLELREALESVSPDTLLFGRANFISDRRYRVTAYRKPKISTDDRSVVYLKSTETHQIVVDSSGAVVDDFIYATDIELVHRLLDEFDSSRQVIYQSNEENLIDEIPLYLISKDGRFVALQLEDDIQVFDLQNNTSQQVPGDGTIVSFSNATDQLLLKRELDYDIADSLEREREYAALYDVYSQSITDVYSNHRMFYPQFSPDGQQVLYSDFDTIYSYDLEEETHTAVYKFRDRKREANPSTYLSPDQPPIILAVPGTEESILVIGWANIYSFSDSDDDGC